jgi:Fe-S oxidoreductase
MKVLLVQSLVGEHEPLVYPVGLACLVPTLGAHDVRTVDTNIYPDPFAALAAVLAEFQPDVVGISFRNMDSPNGRESVSYFDPFKRIVQLVKSSTPARVIVGGAAFSLFAEQIMQAEPGVDFGIFLEGEDAFVALLDNLDTPQSVPSVYYRVGDAVVFSGRGGNPGAIGSPDMAAFPLTAYTHVVVPEAVGVESKRGCALGCVYCPYGFLNGKAYRLKEPAIVADEVAQLAQRGVPRFTFIDSVFNLPRAHAEAVCRAMIERGNAIPWSAWFNEREIDRPFIELVREAGCRTVIVSPDGFSDLVLREMGKSISMDDVHRVHGLFKDMDGMNVSYSFFRNPPGQTLGTFLRLAWFCVRAKLAMGSRVSFVFSRLRIEPHTGVCALAKQEGLIGGEADLIEPTFYSQPKTAYLEYVFDLALRFKGGA